MPADIHTSSLKRRTRFRWILLAVLLGAIALAGWRMYTWRVHEYRFVAIYPCRQYAVTQTSATGFLIQDPQQSLVFHDWEGRELWRITNTQLSGNAAEANEALSADGHTLALVAPEQAGMSLQQWRDGKHLGSTLLPHSQRSRTIGAYAIGMKHAADGRTLFYQIAKHGLSLVVMRDGRVTTRSTFTSPKLPMYPFVDFAPDLSAMIVYPETKEYFEQGFSISMSVTFDDGGFPVDMRQVGYLSITEHGDKYRFTQRFTKSLSVPLRLLDHGKFLTKNGHLVDARGVQTKLKGFKVLPTPESINTGAYYALHPWNYGPTTITSVATRDTWVCPIIGDKHGSLDSVQYYDTCALTPDGQYVLFDINHARLISRTLPSGLMKTLHRYPTVSRLLQPRGQSSCLALVERPGVLRARLPLVRGNNPSYLQQYWKHNGQDYTLMGNAYGLSPDGHALTMQVNQPDASGKDTRYQVLFRW